MAERQEGASFIASAAQELFHLSGKGAQIDEMMLEVIVQQGVIEGI